MTQKIHEHITILIIEDSPFKIEKVKKIVNQIAPNNKIDVANDQISAQKYLAKEKFDLVLLDMQLPNRFGESEPEKNGGENLLKELDFNDDLKHPLKIIAFTQFEELQKEIRSKFPELGAVKFDSSSNEWEKTIYRIIKNLAKIKKEKKKIIYCEEKNDELYNLLGFSSYEFRGLKGGSRKVYEAAKFEKNNFAVRDKDYLTKNEVKWLTQSHFENYFILDFYCFENYLFHPDNINEYCDINNISFNKKEYEDEIRNQKNEKFLEIIQAYKMARQSYFDFTDNSRNNMDEKSGKKIVDSLKSDDFNTFYPYFDMKGTDKKKGFDKKYLEKYNLDSKELVKTSWFKIKMNGVFQKLNISLNN